MHAITYLSKILKNHGWECCPKDEEKIIEPLHPNSIKELKTARQPTAKTESKKIESEEEGYSYRAAI
eukprot:11093453-Ditylum_brightwellii.AAC.1